ncbi:MAG TPA: response regulator [Polyangiaceae bacterium]|jgi:two-component system chemotaxis response regulator CheY
MSATVLVVDDSVLVRQQVGRALTGAGFTIVEAVDGTDALQKLAANPAARLIVCDVNMPGMNGVEFLERLSANGNTLPVVMLTTEGQPELIQRARELGAKGWIVKPFKPDLLIGAVKKLTAAARA